MKKSELMELVGKKVKVTFKTEIDGVEKNLYGKLGFVDEFSAKHDYRRLNYFYIGNTSFKVSHIKKVEVWG